MISIRLLIKSRGEEEIVDEEYDNNERDYITFDYFIMPNHNISIKPRDTIMR